MSKRTFKMDPNLLYSVIKSQAGSLSKAILESVMNSVDAGASEVRIKLSATSYEVSDDGKGFADRNEIEKFFETFGTPHVEGDATYGKFRMGRGQGFAFATNKWRTGEFEMHVDIKSLGLDYILKDGLEPKQGCLIQGDLFDPLLPSDLLQNIRSLKEQCKYTPIPVFLNDELISKDVTKEKWDYVTDEAYIRLSTTARGLSVFNLGVLVNTFSAYEFGVSGEVVSRVQLELNFARNDIMRASCKAWKVIKPYLRKLSDEINGKEDKKVRITEEWRCMKADMLMALTPEQPLDSYQHINEYDTASLFTDISGKHYSLAQLTNSQRLSRVGLIAIGNKTSLAVDRVHASKLALVLDEDIFKMRFHGITFSQLIAHLKTLRVYSRSNNPNYGHGPAFSLTVTSLETAFVEDISKLTDTFDSEHEIIEAKALSKVETAVLSILNKVNDDLVRYMNVAYGDHVFSVREIGAMRSETASAFTNGTTHIFIEQSFLSGANKGPLRGYPWAMEIVALLVHEYCHNFNSGLGHQHDAEFFEAFHRIMMSSGNVSNVPLALFKEWVEVSAKVLGKLGRAAFQADMNANHESLAASVA